MWHVEVRHAMERVPTDTDQPETMLLRQIHAMSFEARMSLAAEVLDRCCAEQPLRVAGLLQDGLHDAFDRAYRRPTNGTG